MTLRIRLLTGLGLLVLTAVISSGWLVLQVARRELDAAQLADGRVNGIRLIRVLSSAAAETRGTLDAPATRQALAQIAGEWRARGVVQEIAIVKDGVALIGTARSEDALGTVASDVVVRRDGDRLRIHGAIAGIRGDRAAVRIELAGDDLIGRALDRAGWLVALVALLGATAVMVFGAVFVDRIARTITTLAAAARRVASGQLEEKPLPADARGDELARLAADFNEMTDALRRERATVSAQRDSLIAQEKLATVGRLAAGVAHEIGNPLAAILGFSDMLRDDEGEQRPERRLAAADRKDAVERIRGEAMRIQTIIRELLDYSRPVPAATEAVDLVEAIDRAVSLCRPQPRFRDVQVERELPAELARCLASSARVEQILVNLLLNAADAMGGRGRLVIGAGVANERVELWVTDFGPGVIAADRDKIFDPFFTTKEPGSGTGLGLSVSLAIAQAFGGELTLDAPAEGRGARFILSLPRVVVDPPTA